MREVKKKELRKILETLNTLLPELHLKVKTLFERKISEDLSIYLQDPEKNVVAIAFKGEIFPALNLLWKLKLRPKGRYIVVDQGAIKPVLRGAKILRPGVREACDIEKHSLCFVIEEVNRTPIAIGYCLVSENELKAMDRGPVALNVHHINDKIWKIDF